MSIDTSELQAQGSPQAIILRGKDKEAPGQVYVEHFSDSMRMWRGAKIGAICFLVTVASAFIPILHFIITPIFLILTFVMGAVAMGPKSIILGGSGTCPCCDKEFRIFKRQHRFPFNDVCEGCGRSITISAVDF